jgi:hypothetical protein
MKDHFRFRLPLPHLIRMCFFSFLGGSADAATGIAEQAELWLPWIRQVN